MNMITQPKSMRVAVTVFVLIISSVLLPIRSNAAVMDNGVDPANLGLGQWIYFLKDATNQLGGNVDTVTNVASLMRYYRKVDIDYVVVKAGTGGIDFPPNNPQFTRELVKAAHHAGLKIFGYTRSDGKDVPGEIALANKIYELGADGFVIDRI